MIQIMSETLDLLGPLNDVETRFAPAKLYFSGDQTLLQQSPRVAVVGSRKPSPEAIRRTHRLVRLLVVEEAIIVSGLAMGIDTAAHQATLQNAGKTIAVLGTPLSVATPRSNKPLQDTIAKEHLVVSQFPEGSTIRPHNFPMRNRTMALICQASVIVEAGDGSGTLSQGWEALRLGRPLFIMRSVVDNPALTWPRQMLEYGARVLGDDIGDILEILPPPGRLELAVHAF